MFILSFPLNETIQTVLIYPEHIKAALRDKESFIFIVLFTEYKNYVSIEC